MFKFEAAKGGLIRFGRNLGGEATPRKKKRFVARRKKKRGSKSWGGGGERA